MKKIFFNTGGSNGHNFFWKPNSFMGYLWRVLLFLLLLFVLLWLLSMFRGCEREYPRYEIPREILNPGERHNPIVPIDTVANERTNFPNPGNNLPAPDRNYIPPINEDDIIERDRQQIVGNKFNIIIDAENGEEEIRSWSQQFKQLYPEDSYKIVYYDPLTKLMQAQVPQDKLSQVMSELPTKITNVSFKLFHERLLGPMVAPPSDPGFTNQYLRWYFEPIQAYEAWEITKGSSDVVVAIVDSYFDVQHEELNSNRIVSPYSIVRRTANVAPNTSCDRISFMHGSMVASQAIGNIENSRGLSGIAPKCKFMPISMGHTFTSMTMLQGTLYAIYKGADVVNISAGSILRPYVGVPVRRQIEMSKTMMIDEEDVWAFVFNMANRRNVTIVWAAGNDNVFAGLDPSKRDSTTIRVTAVDQQLKKARFSNYGNLPQYNTSMATIAAPGVNIFGAKPYNSYDIGPGTSFAAPIVTGAVALMKSVNPDITNQQIIDILQRTGKPINGDSRIGKLIQIRDAVEAAKQLRESSNTRGNSPRRPDPRPSDGFGKRR